MQHQNVLAPNKALTELPGLGRYDSTVRNAGGNIVQFLYGEDGMDGTQIEGQKVTLHTLDDAKFKVRLWHLALHREPSKRLQPPCRVWPVQLSNGHCTADWPSKAGNVQSSNALLAGRSSTCAAGRRQRAERSLWLATRVLAEHRQEGVAAQPGPGRDWMRTLCA